MNPSKLLLVFVALLLGTGCSKPNTQAAPALAPLAQTLDFDIYVQGQQAMAVYTGSLAVRSGNEFRGGALIAIGNATGCSLRQDTIVISIKHLAGILDCKAEAIAPKVQTAQSLRVSPRRGLGAKIPIEHDTQIALPLENQL